MREQPAPAAAARPGSALAPSDCTGGSTSDPNRSEDNCNSGGYTTPLNPAHSQYDPVMMLDPATVGEGAAAASLLMMGSSHVQQRRSLKPPAGYPQSVAATPAAVSPRPLHDPLAQPLLPVNGTSSRRSGGKSSSHATSTFIACLYCLLILLQILIQASRTPLQATLFVTLILYAADLANVPRRAFLALLLGSAAALVGLLVVAAAEDAAGAGPLLGVAALSVLTMAALCLWVLRHGVAWLGGDAATTTARQLQAALHALLPPLCAALTALALGPPLDGGYTYARYAELLPIVFAAALAGSMLWIGAAVRSSEAAPATRHGGSLSDTSSVDATTITGSSVGDGSTISNGNYKSKASSTAFCISPAAARGHVLMLLALPTAMQLVLGSGHRFSLAFVYDLLVVGCLSYLLQYTIAFLDHFHILNSPYVRSPGSSRFRQAFAPPSTVRACLLPVSVLLVFCWAIQQRYLISLSLSVAHRFLGTRPTVPMLSLYWMLCTVSLLVAAVLQTAASFASWRPQDMLLGEYQEDAIQLFLGLAGATLGKAFGMEWNFTALPILAVLGLALWLTSQLLRYLVVFLFVTHATGVVVFTYRFVGMEQVMLELPLPGKVQVSILRFAYCLVWSASLIGLTAGFSIRSTGGFLGKILKKIDATGVCMLLYTLTSSVLEIALLKRTIPTNELAGVDVDGDETQENEVLYDHSTAILSSVVLVVLASMMMRSKLVSEITGWAVIALGLGKAIAIYIDAVIVTRDPSKLSGNGNIVFVRTLVAAAPSLVVILPRTLIEPVHFKAISRRRTLHDAFNSTDIPRSTLRKMLIYAAFVLPATLALAIPYVFLPLTKVLNEQFRDDYVYSSRSPLPEIFGGSIALWALSCLFFLNHCFPDGGGEGWKKISGLAFLFGMGVVFVGPTLSSGVDVASNPYAAMSNLGSRLVSRGYRTGGWGVLSTAFATLLAVAGPLELKERQPVAGRKDRFLLARTMLFSLLFGGGVAWFVVLQSMREADVVSLVIVLSSSLAIAFMGTIAAVFGYFLKLEEFHEARQMIVFWTVIWAAVVSFCCFAESFVTESLQLFASGGWLSTILMVSCITALSMVFSIKSRKTKDQWTRASSNMLTILSWALANALLFGRCGVAGVGADHEVQTLFGLPTSIVGAFLLSPMLLLLEGETQSIHKTSLSKSGVTGIRHNLFSFPSLNRSNRWAPLFFGSVLILLLASLYSVLLRGAAFLSFLDGGVGHTQNELLRRLFRDEKDADSRDLAVLVEKVMSHNAVLAASTRLANSSIWTANNMLSPMLHLIGIVATLPSLTLLFLSDFRRKTVSATHATLALPLNAIPTIICLGVPSLQAAGLMILVAGFSQSVRLRRASKESMMRI